MSMVVNGRRMSLLSVYRCLDEYFTADIAVQANTTARYNSTLYKAANDSGASQSRSASADVLFGLFLITMVFGEANIALMIILIKKRLFDPVRNVLIFSLTLSNALLVNTCVFALVTMRWRTWLFGQVVCKIYWLAEQSNKYAGIFSFCVVSLDNFIIVRYPTRARFIRTRRYAAGLAVVAWASALLLLVPIPIYARALDYAIVVMCVIYWPRDVDVEKIYTHVSFTVAFLIPLVAMIFILPVTLKRLSAQTPLRGRSPQNYRGTIVLLTALTVCYVVCWTPYWLLNYYGNIFNGRFTGGWMSVIVKILTLLPYVNAAAYPYSYLLLPRNRMAIRGLCRGQVPVDV